MKFSAPTKVLGSVGCQPAVLGSLPSTCFARVNPREQIYRLLCKHAAGKLPAAAGWQPALPKPK